MTLLAHEQAELEQLEAQIEHGALEMARSLMTIRDRKLYRKYGTFEAYCQQRWQFEDRRARQLISFAETVNRLEGVSPVLPMNERQARPLEGLPVEQQAEVMLAAAAISGGKPANSHIQRAADAAKAKSPLLEPGQQLPVLDESNDRYGQTVTVEKVDGVMVACKTAEGEAAYFLTTDLLVPPAPKRTQSPLKQILRKPLELPSASRNCGQSY